jgi:hypothetical protein
MAALSEGPESRTNRQKKFKDLIELIELGDRDPVLESKVRTAHGTAAAGLLAVCPAARGALGDAAAFELRGDAEHGKDKLGKIGLVSTTGSAIERKPAPARCMSRATQKIGLSRERRSTAGI